MQVQRPLDQLCAHLLRQGLCGQRAWNGEPERGGLIRDALSGRLDLKNARGGRRTLRDADQCEGLHARFRRHRLSDVMETAERNDRRHVAKASRHDGGGERARLSGLPANLHQRDELPGSDASQHSGRCSGSPAVTIDATPGTNWVYSGGGYEIAESLIGDVMGTTYGDFVQAKVLAP